MTAVLKVIWKVNFSKNFLFVLLRLESWKRYFVIAKKIKLKTMSPNQDQSYRLGYASAYFEDKSTKL